MILLVFWRIFHQIINFLINKIDLGTDQVNDEVKKYDPIYISIKEEKNLDKLIKNIKDNLKNKFISSDDIYITRKRHRT